MLPEKLGSFLHHCTKTKAFERGLSLHASAVKTGRQSEIFIGNHVLNFYAKCDCIDSAMRVFEEMPQKNLVTWSALISGFDQSNRPHLTIQLFSQMQKYFKPNEFVFASTLSSCSGIKDSKLGLQIHAQALKLSHASVSFVRNSLILMYMKCGMCAHGLLIFTDSECDPLTLVSYNIAITGLVENKEQEKGIEMFMVMCRGGLVPDRFTFAGLLGPGEVIYDLPVVMQLHCQMVKLGLDYTAFSANVLMTLYSKFDLMAEMEKVFTSIEERDVYSWNTAIAACCRSEDNSKALRIFRKMVMEHNVIPDDFTYASVLTAAAGLASMRYGKEIHAHLFRTRLDWDIGVGNALINMYAKSGSISSGYTIFDQMEIHNLVSWNSIIAAFATHGLAQKAFALFNEMMTTGLGPDSVTFLEMLTACSHSGLAEEGQALFNSMNKVYGITPNIEHLCCLVDLLGRAGRVTEAEEYIRRYSAADDAVVLGSLLSACRLHEGVVVGEHIARRLLELHPVTSSPYVLLSNLYASDRKWDGVAGARKMLQVSGLKKKAAHSLIEVKGSSEKFIIGDFSHSKMDEILDMLRTLTRVNDEDLLCY
ncbi:UNVERIFIED_CONTAM: Pentatricopeptide repeat-containing protein [Sesamum indicum]